MFLRRMTGIGVAAALAVGIAAFGPATSQAQETSAVGENRANQRTGAVTMEGCLMRESDFRRAHNLGGGAAGGMGLGDEFVIVDTRTTSTTNTTTTPSTTSFGNPATPSSSAINCAEAGNGPAYRITGSMEDKMKGFVGRRLEVSGFFQPDRDGESKLPEEVDVRSYREYTATAETVSSSAVVAEARTEPAPAVAEVEVAEVRREPAPAPAESFAMAEESREAMPRTASPIPLIGLIGLFSLGSGIWLTRRSKS